MTSFLLISAQALNLRLFHVSLWGGLCEEGVILPAPRAKDKTVV